VPPLRIKTGRWTLALKLAEEGRVACTSFLHLRRAVTISALAPSMVNGSLSLKSDNPGEHFVNPWAFLMSEREDPDSGQESPSEENAGQELLPPSPEAGRGGPAGSRSVLLVPVFIALPFGAEPTDKPGPPRPSVPSRPLLAWAAAIAAAGVLAGGALWAFDVHRSQARLLAEQAHENQALAKMLDALTARLGAMEIVKPNELVELRRSVGEIRASVVSSRDLGGAIAQLAQRVEKLDREESAKLDKLNERVEREANAQAAEVAARIEKLEKKVVASAAPAPANPPSPPQKQPPPKIGPNVSMETTGSIDRPRPVLRGYIILGARADVALVEGRDGERAVRPGDFLPGAGRVERIAREGGAWAVVTEQGLIRAADPAD
jgi:hypothetical protein